MMGLSTDNLPGAHGAGGPSAPGPPPGLGRPVGLERPCFLGLGTAHWDCEYTHGASSVFVAVHVQREPSEEELERH